MHDANMIPHSRPRVGAGWLDGVRRVLRSGQLAAGDELRSLESEVAARLHQPCAAAVDSGTSALMLAIRALKVANDKGDIARFVVGIPAYTCVSVLHAVLAAGATPLCMDCGDDLRLDRDKALTMARQLDAVVLVHPFGYAEPCISDAWPCPVIEDISQSAGACWQGHPLGSAGDMSIVSFYATKPWGGAYGGMVLSRDAQLIAQIRRMRRSDDCDTGVHYAGNHQLSDMHAVLAHMRLQQADQERERRNSCAALFDDCFAAASHQSLSCIKSSSYYRYIVRCSLGADSVIRHFRQQRIYACRPVKQPISTLLGDDSCCGAESAWHDCVSIPLLNDFSADEMQRMCEAIKALPAFLSVYSAGADDCGLRRHVCGGT